MLTPNPTMRISSKEALENPFFDHLKQHEKDQNLIETNYLEKVKANLLEYNSL